MRESAFIDWLEIVDGRDVRQTRDNVRKSFRPIMNVVTKIVQRIKIV